MSYSINHNIATIWACSINHSIPPRKETAPPSVGLFILLMAIGCQMVCQIRCCRDSVIHGTVATQPHNQLLVQPQTKKWHTKQYLHTISRRDSTNNITAKRYTQRISGADCPMARPYIPSLMFWSSCICLGMTTHFTEANQEANQKLSIQPNKP